MKLFIFFLVATIISVLIALTRHHVIGGVLFIVNGSTTLLLSINFLDLPKEEKK